MDESESDYMKLPMENIIQMLVAGDKIVTLEYISERLTLHVIASDLETVYHKLKIDHSYEAAEPVARLAASFDESLELDGIAMCTYLPDS